MNARFLENLEQSLAAYLAEALGPIDGANVQIGRRAGIVEARPALGVSWMTWTPVRNQWGGTSLRVMLRIYCYSVKLGEEIADHAEEGRLHLAALLALTDQGTIPLNDYSQSPPVAQRSIEIEWVNGNNPPEPQSRSRSETYFDVVASTQED